MKKQHKLYFSWGITILATVLGVIAFFMIFVDAIKFNGKLVQGNYSGLQVALGYKINTISVFEASAGIILAFALPLLGACVALMGKGNNIVTCLAALMMLTGGVLAFCTVELLHYNAVGTPSLAAGPIAAGILSILGAATAGFSVFFDAKLSK